MKVAVLLQTCERAEMTARTVASFVAMNRDVSRFDLLHGDDASTTPDNQSLANAHGFRTVVRTNERKGMLQTRIALLDAAAHRGAQWVLLLENDCESVRPFPWAVFDWMQQFDGVYCLRLFGQYKDAHRKEPCKTSHQWIPESFVRWKAVRGAPERVEIGSIHWTAQPAVTRMREAVGIHMGGWRPLKVRTMRMVDNVMVHIGGSARTPGRKQ